MSRFKMFSALNARYTVSCVLLGASLAAAPAYAQDLEEVIVTAQRREQSIQDVAISMAAFTADQLERSGAQNLYDLAQMTPNVHVSSFYDNSRPEITIRGLSGQKLFTGYEQMPVGVYNDEVFIGARSAQMTQMFDLERVEVLRGPQGTLYGRNTSAGAVNLISQKPKDRFEASGALTLGSYSQFDIEGMLNTPVSENVAVRLAAINRDREGYITNRFAETGAAEGMNPNRNVADKLGDINSWAARALVSWNASATASWLFNLHGYSSDTRTPAWHSIGRGHNEPNTFSGYVDDDGDVHTLSINFTPRSVIDNWGSSLTGRFEVFGGATLTSVTAFEETKFYMQEDSDGTPFDSAQTYYHEKHRQISQELRLAHQHEGGLDWVAGLYYYADDLDGGSFIRSNFDPRAIPAGSTAVPQIPRNVIDQETSNWAAFADLRYPLTDTLTLNVGGRYTSEKKRADFDATRFFPLTNTLVQAIDIVREADWQKPTWKIAAEWKPAGNVLAYANYAKGFKSGGFNGWAYANALETLPYEPEITDSYELGIKTSWLDRRVTVNVAAFYTEIEDLQALFFDAGGAGVFVLTVRNAERAHTQGAELELTARPNDRLLLTLGGGIANTEFDELVLALGTNYSGKELTGSPDYTMNAAIQYDFTLSGRGLFQSSTLSPRLQYARFGNQWFDPANRPLLDEQKAYGLLNASLDWTSDDRRVEASLWVHNATDEEYFIKTIGNQLANRGGVTALYGPPRMYGVSVRFRM